MTKIILILVVSVLISFGAGLFVGTQIESWFSDEEASPATSILTEEKSKVVIGGEVDAGLLGLMVTLLGLGVIAFGLGGVAAARRSRV